MQWHVILGRGEYDELTLYSSVYVHLREVISIGHIRTRVAGCRRTIFLTLT